MKAIIILFFSIFCLSTITAQQEPMFTKYMFNSSILNPGFTGSHLGEKASATYRNQWTGVKGAPRTYWVGGDAAFGINKSARFGLNIGLDQIGINQLSAAFANYAYGITLNRKEEIAIGVKAGGYFFSSSPEDLLNLTHAGDPLHVPTSNSFVPTFGMGIFYRYDDIFYGGFSIPTLAVINTSGNGVADSFFDQHYYLQGGYSLRFGRGVRHGNEIKFTALTKFQRAAPIQFDVAATYYFPFDLGLGIGYRSGDSVYANIEIPIGKNVYIGYAHDFTVTEIRNYSNGVHEIMVGYLREGKTTGFNNPIRWFR